MLNTTTNLSLIAKHTHKTALPTFPSEKARLSGQPFRVFEFEIWPNRCKRAEIVDSPSWELGKLINFPTLSYDQLHGHFTRSHTHTHPGPKPSEAIALQTNPENEVRLFRNTKRARDVSHSAFCYHRFHWTPDWLVAVASLSLSLSLSVSVSG